ncbi:MAG: hypothetical protein K2G36_02185, partial [Ruminococcus sp.]|nr:hypothetical protein [Ruminococcus sp.]
KKSEKPDTKKSEKSEPKKSEKPDTKQSEKTEPKKSGQTDVSAIPLLNGKYNFITLLGITIIILILILGIRSCANGKASDEKYRQAIYPAVITDINEFENASELPVSQILSTAVWSVIIDNEKLSAYPQRVDDMAIIPAEDIEKYATEIFGEDIPELTHNTILTADSKFYYNEEADSYTVEVTPHTVTYKPEVVSVTNRNGKYIVDVNYIDQYPEWIEDTVAKTAEYVLSKNGDGGYVIESMHETSETETVSTTTEATSEEEISQENMSVTTE